MNGQRLKGFVLGRDTNPGCKPRWKVRVSSEGPHQGEKLVVASVHGGIELARGLNVDFAIGTVDGPEGQKVRRVVDVRLD